MQTKCGYVALIGRPNVGKSTLLNHFVGQKVCITADKPQTTRHQIQGICSTDAAQVIFVDTPGLHQAGKKALNRQLNREALHALAAVDVIVQVFAGRAWSESDAWIYQQAKQTKKPMILLVNKVDKISDKDQLLPLLAKLDAHLDLQTLIPLSAMTGDNCEALWQALLKLMPTAPFAFAADALTNKSTRFMLAELMREQLFRHLGDELPYSSTVTVDSFLEEEHCTRLQLTVWVEKPGQKAIVIGKQGAQLKRMVSIARASMETLLQRQVYVEVWVKIKKGWTDDSELIQRLGGHDNLY